MIDVDALLNPAFQNPELRAYAYLSAQFKSGVRSPLDCLRPFVVYALSEFSGHQLNWQAIRDKLYARYRLNIPFYMLERMQEPLARMGALTASDIPRVYLCADARPAVSHKSVDFSISDIDEAARALAHFATARGVSKPLTADTWSDVLVPFFLSKSPPKDKATATVRGVIISDPKAFDFSHVAEFIVEQQRMRSPIYRTLEKIYYGALVSDFLTQFERNGDKAAFKGLSIYYDGPVILRLLGLSGRVLEGATLELHDVLKELGCRICFFSHTYDEVSDSIEAILKCYENGQPIFKDTQEAISRGELKIADVYRAKSDLDLILSANLGLIEQTGGYANRESDSFQIDEDAFKAYLSRNKTWGREYSLAADRDARSLALILRLRNGKVARDVTKSGYVFITHNVRLTILAKDFLKSERQLSEGSIWPFMTVGQMATIAWVANEAFGSEGRFKRAYCKLLFGLASRRGF